MVRRAAPRVVVVLVLSAGSALWSALSTGVVAHAVRSSGFVVIVAAFASKDWWRYVKLGKPASWRIDHGGDTALFVIDPGPERWQVIAHLREHGGLSYGEASERADDPSRPVWDDLTRESADRIGAVLAGAGASVRVGPRRSPSWSRDVTGR
ncbi:hypothetical protein M1L60_25420 [Actinoplanes sp. TRM 88003]|uniref:Uncharacterized protein n=1 Tax=Paractinoplanes aksuensis TaxID=2939490 RepID=A0ABT1DTT8_9ACTN|nr:hypothetical protein [Actinoplanes aksuensis]MCO8273943.1 hypothetical protein [Actinoplanes aksuensis]